MPKQKEDGARGNKENKKTPKIVTFPTNKFYISSELAESEYIERCRFSCFALLVTTTISIDSK